MSRRSFLARGSVLGRTTQIVPAVAILAVLWLVWSARSHTTLSPDGSRPALAASVTLPQATDVTLKPVSTGQPSSEAQASAVPEMLGSLAAQAVQIAPPGVLDPVALKEARSVWKQIQDKAIGINTLQTHVAVRVNDVPTLEGDVYLDWKKPPPGSNEGSAAGTWQARFVSSGSGWNIVWPKGDDRSKLWQSSPGQASALPDVAAGALMMALSPILQPMERYCDDQNNTPGEVHICTQPITAVRQAFPDEDIAEAGAPASWVIGTPEMKLWMAPTGELRGVDRSLRWDGTFATRWSGYQAVGQVRYPTSVSTHITSTHRDLSEYTGRPDKEVMLTASLSNVRINEPVDASLFVCPEHALDEGEVLRH